MIGVKPENIEDTSKKKKKANIFKTFTKMWVTILLVIAIIDLQLSYILAFIGKDTIAESLSIAIVTEIIGVSCVYMIRAFFDTMSEKKHDLDVRKFEESLNNECLEDSINTENAEG